MGYINWVWYFRLLIIKVSVEFSMLCILIFVIFLCVCEYILRFEMIFLICDSFFKFFIKIVLLLVIILWSLGLVIGWICGCCFIWVMYLFRKLKLFIINLSGLLILWVMLVVNLFKDVNFFFCWIWCLLIMVLWNCSME